MCVNLSARFVGCLVYNSHVQMELLSNGMFDMEIGWNLHAVCIVSSQLLFACLAVMTQFV